MIVGSLNLYAQEPHAFSDADMASTQVFAAEVANAIVKSATMRKVQGALEDLQRDRDESTLVSRAQGVLMAIQDCSAVQARNLIANASRENGESLLRTAERILASARTWEPTLPVAES
jgi:AmiR/NasT family two-component response regulator